MSIQITNTRLLIIIASVFLLLLSACDTGTEITPQSHIESAKRLIAEGKLNASTIELKNALQKESNLPEARWLLGTIYLKFRNGTAAAKELKDAQTLGYDNPDMEANLLRAVLYQGKFQDVIDRTANSDGQSIELLILRANAFLGMKKYLDASATFNRALAADPDSVDAMTGLAQVSLIEKKTDDAKKLVEAAFSRNPGDLDVWILRGQIALLENKPDDAETAFREAVSIADYNTVAQFGLVRAFLVQGKSDAALESISRVEKRFPRHPLATFFRAYIALADKDIENAKLLLQDVLKIIPTHPESLLLLSRIHYDANQLEQAKEYISNFLNNNPDHLPALKLLSVITLALRQTDEALATLSSAASNVPAMVNLAKIDLNKGNQDASLKRFNQVLQIDADNAEALISLARIEAGRNNTAKAQSLLEKARAANSKSLTARMLLARFYLDTGDTVKMLEIAQEAHNLSPTNPQVLLLLGQAQRLNNNSNDSIGTLESLVKLVPNSSSALFQLSITQYEHGEFKAARKTLKDILKIDSSHVGALDASARLAIDDKDTKLARQYLSEIRNTKKDPTTADILQGDILVAENRLDEAISVYKKVAVTADNGSVVNKLAQSYRLSGDLEKAISTLNEWLKEDPEDLNVRLFLANLYQKEKRDKLAIEQFEIILEQDSNHIVALNNLAWLYLDVDLARAFEMAQKSQIQLPDRPEIQDTLGWILIKQRKFEEGITYLSGALEQMPDSPDIRYHFASALVLSGNIERGHKELKTLLEEHDSFASRKEAEKLYEALQ
ncbi:MAG: tetratricopeptide repeat protein [Gammaproteobacteria bacterium]|nr:tetratricopeptide repeat protein [Gammaproteobacteria bacterium]